MSKDRQQLILGLSEDLPATQYAGNLWPSAMWLGGGLLLVAVLAWFDGPFRPGAWYQLQSSPQFFIESVIGLLAVALLVFSAFELSIPGRANSLRRLVMPIGALLAWVAGYVWGLLQPALEPTVSGQRAFCYAQTLLYSIPLLMAGVFWARRQYPLQGVRIGLLLGLAAGAVPALVMQFACMYAPDHILQHHILPGLSAGVLGALAGAIFLKQK